MTVTTGNLWWRAMQRVGMFFKIDPRRRLSVPVATWVAAAMIGGCDIPERPPLPRAGGRQRLDLDDLDAVRRAAGLPAETPVNPSALSPPPLSRHRVTIETSSLSPGGPEVVGTRRSEVVEADSRDDTRWLIEDADPPRAGQAGSATGSVETASSATGSAERTRGETVGGTGRAGYRQVISSERLWVRQNRCVVLASTDIRETIDGDGRLVQLAMRRRFGPMVYGLIGVPSDVDRSADDGFDDSLDRSSSGAQARPWRLTAGFGSRPDRRWASQAMTLSPRTGGPLADAYATSNLVHDPERDADLIRRLTLAADPGRILRPPVDVRLQIVGPAAIAIGGSASKPGGNAPPEAGRLVANRMRRLTEVTAVTLPGEDQDDRAGTQEVYWLSDDGVIQKKLRADGLIEWTRPEDSSLAAGDGMPAPSGGVASVTVGGKPWDSASAETVAIRIVDLSADADAAAETPATPTEASGNDSALGGGSDDPAAFRIPVGPGQAARRSGRVTELLIDRRGQSPESFERMDRATTTADTAATPLANYNQSSMRKLARASSRVSTSGAVVLEAGNLTAIDRVDSRIAADMLSVTASLVAAAASVGDDVILPADQSITRARGGPVARSIVLATLLRGRGIACTLAMGLAADPGDDAIGGVGETLRFDCWVLARLDGRWVSLVVGDDDQQPLEADQTLRRADRILLSTCDPTLDQIESSMRRVLNQMGRMEIEVVGTR